MPVSHLLSLLIWLPIVGAIAVLAFGRNPGTARWLSLAVAGYTPKNQERLDQARKDLEILTKRMTPAQITEAQRRIKAFKPVP